jgi:hypothetical protein
MGVRVLHVTVIMLTPIGPTSMPGASSRPNNLLRWIKLHCMPANVEGRYRSMTCEPRDGTFIQCQLSPDQSILNFDPRATRLVDDEGTMPRRTVARP